MLSLEMKTWMKMKASTLDYTNTKFMCKYIHKLKHWVLIAVISGAVLLVVCCVVQNYIVVLCKFPDNCVKMFLQFASFMSFSASNYLYHNYCICYITQIFSSFKNFDNLNRNTRKCDIVTMCSVNSEE